MRQFQREIQIEILISSNSLHKKHPFTINQSAFSYEMVYIWLMTHMKHKILINFKEM